MRTSRFEGHTDQKNTIYGMRMHQNLPFSRKNGQKWPFFAQKLSFLASDKQLKTPPPFFEGAGCEEACCMDTQIAQTQFIAC